MRGKIRRRPRRAVRIRRVTCPRLSPSAWHVRPTRQYAAAALPATPRRCPLGEKFTTCVGPRVSAAVAEAIGVKAATDPYATATLSCFYAAGDRHGETRVPVCCAVAIAGFSSFT